MEHNRLDFRCSSVDCLPKLLPKKRQNLVRGLVANAERLEAERECNALRAKAAERSVLREELACAQPATARVPGLVADLASVGKQLAEATAELEEARREADKTRGLELTADAREAELAALRQELAQARAELVRARPAAARTVGDADGFCRGRIQVIEGSRRVHPGAGPIRFGAAPYTLCVEGGGQGCVCAHGCTCHVGRGSRSSTLNSRRVVSRPIWTRQKAANRAKQAAGGDLSLLKSGSPSIPSTHRC